MCARALVSTCVNCCVVFIFYYSKIVNRNNRCYLSASASGYGCCVYCSRIRRWRLFRLIFRRFANRDFKLVLNLEVLSVARVFRIVIRIIILHYLEK